MNGCTGGHFTKLREEDTFLSFEEYRQQILQKGTFLFMFSGFLCMELHSPCGEHIHLALGLLTEQIKTMSEEA